MEFDTAGLVTSVDAALRQAGQLTVAYSFSIVGAIILLVAGFLVAGAAERWSYAGLGRIRAFDETLRKFFSKALRYAVLILVGVTVLAQFGVQTASIIAALGAIGLAIGLALQGTLQNIAAGIMLLVLKPFRVGEYVEAGSLSGTIEEIGLFATELKRFDGLYVLAPNSQLWSSPVTNYSRNHIRRNDLTIGIGYDDDIEQALSILRTIAEDDPCILSEPAPAAFVSELGESAVQVSVRYWSMTSDWWQVRLDITRKAKAAFDGHGISIPFPQRDIRYIPRLKDAASPRETVETR